MTETLRRSSWLNPLLLLPISGITETFRRSNRLNPQLLQKLWSLYQIILFLFPGFCLDGVVFKGIVVGFVLITFCLFDAYICFIDRERTKERKTIAVSVPDRKKKTLTKLLKQHVNFGSIVHNDGWKGWDVSMFWMLIYYVYILYYI